MNPMDPDECCPRFDPFPWDNKIISWENKLFLQDRVVSFLHIPLNFGAVMKRSMASMEAAGAVPDEMIVLSDEGSLWGADVYIAVSKEVPGSSSLSEKPHATSFRQSLSRNPAQLMLSVWLDSG